MRSAVARLLLVVCCVQISAATAGFHSKTSRGERASFTVHGHTGGDKAPHPHGRQPTTTVGAAGTVSSLEDSNAFLTFSSENEYMAVQHSPWKNLAEPFRVTTLRASSSVGDPDNDVFTWSFADKTVLEGREVKHIFKTLGRQAITISQTVVATGETHSVDEFVMVKYVRREIRQLTTKDREAFFDAMETLYRLPTKQGVNAYGEEYKGIEFFVQMHLDGAGVKDCDHWHDDAGIMTHHVGYTLLFEQALQLVNPAVSIPYWEYTIEAASGFDSYGESEVFADDWFGEASPDNLLHTMDTGRWAYIPVMKDAWDYVHNSYGLLRTPWNLDSTPFVTRHNTTSDKAATTMVSCETYSRCFDSSDMKNINNCLNGGTHGPVHIIMGGEWDDPEEDFVTAVGFNQLIPLITKYLWRKGYLRYPDSCTEAVQGGKTDSNCRSSCPADLYESRGMTPYDVLYDTLALHWIGGFSGGIIKHLSDGDRFVVAGHEDDMEFQQAFWKKLLRSLCDPGHVGELFTSSAPYDPLFWVIHPTAERFLSWRRMLGRDGVDGYDFDEEWGYTHGNVVGETGTVCDWSEVRDGTLDMPTCIKGICGGHNVDDILPFDIKVNGEVRKMSNAEWLAFIYPDNEDLPYLYNEYRWDHCAAEGFSIGTLA